MASSKEEVGLLFRSHRVQLGELAFICWTFHGKPGEDFLQAGLRKQHTVKSNFQRVRREDAFSVLLDCREELLRAGFPALPCWMPLKRIKVLPEISSYMPPDFHGQDFSRHEILAC